MTCPLCTDADTDNPTTLKLRIAKLRADLAAARGLLRRTEQELSGDAPNITRLLEKIREQIWSWPNAALAEKPDA
jgi:hypothetical protein